MSVWFCSRRVAVALNPGAPASTVNANMPATTAMSTAKANGTLRAHAGLVSANGRDLTSWAEPGERIVVHVGGARGCERADEQRSPVGGVGENVSDHSGRGEYIRLTPGGVDKGLVKLVLLGGLPDVAQELGPVVVQPP